MLAPRGDSRPPTRLPTPLTAQRMESPLYIGQGDLVKENVQLDVGKLANVLPGFSLSMACAASQAGPPAQSLASCPFSAQPGSPFPSLTQLWPPGFFARYLPCIRLPRDSRGCPERRAPHLCPASHPLPCCFPTAVPQMLSIRVAQSNADELSFCVSGSPGPPSFRLGVSPARYEV